MVCGIEESGVEECYMRTFVLPVFLFLSYAMRFSFCSSTDDIE